MCYCRVCAPRGVSKTSRTARSPMTWTDLLTLALNKPISVPRPHDAGSTPRTSACPEESMSSLRLRLPRMCIALRETNWLQIQRIRLRATMWNQRERKRLLPIDIRHCLYVVRPLEDVMAPQEWKEVRLTQFNKLWMLILYIWTCVHGNLSSCAQQPWGQIFLHRVWPWLMLGQHKTEVSQGACANPQWFSYSCHAINTLGSQ